MNTIFKRFEALATNAKADNFKGAVIRLTAYYTVGVFLVLVAFSFLVYGLFLVDISGKYSEYTEIVTFVGGEEGEPVSHEVAEHLFDILVLSDAILLFFTIIVSYVLARRTLAPLAESYQRQKTFVADAAHELRTPLSVMKAGAEFLLQKPRTSERYVSFIHESQEEIDRLIALANDLLFLAQNRTLEQKARERFSLSELCTRQGTQITPYAHFKNVTISVDVEPDIFVVGSEGDITRLLLNLLKNAIDYNKIKGSVVLHLHRAGSEAVLTIRDTGIGISPEDIPHIFDRFYKADTSRTQSTVSGSGLGLSIVKEIAEQHGGVVRVESTLGEGTTFELRIPCA